MSSQATVTPIFNALTGPELKAVILAAIDQALSNTNEFESHVTFPWLKYAFKVEITSYPKQSMEDAPGIKTSGMGEKGEKDSSKGEITHSIEGAQTIDTPDKARIGAKLPVPRPAKAAANITVDKPIAPKEFDAGTGTKS